MTGLISRHRWPHGRGVALLGRRPIVFDAFNRANSTSTLGKADTGQSWSAITGTWGISSNQAYNPTGDTGAFAVVESGVANGIVRATITARRTTSGIYFRVVDSDNWLRMVCHSSTAMDFDKCVAGTVTEVAQVTLLTLKDGDVYGVRLNGTQVILELNGSRIGSPQTVTDHATATKHGIGMETASTTSRWDNFQVLV